MNMYLAPINQHFVESLQFAAIIASNSAVLLRQILNFDLYAFTYNIAA